MPATALDQIAGQRIALRVEGEDVGGIFAHREHLREGDPPTGREVLDQKAVLPGALHRMLYGRAGPLVGPARQRTAEVAGEDRMGDLVGEDRVEDPFFTPLDRHRPAEHLAGVEDKARSAAGPEMRGDLGLDRTGAVPPRQRFAEPFHREVMTILLGGSADLSRLAVGRRVDDEVRGPMTGGTDPSGPQGEHGSEHHEHRSHEASFQHVGSTSVGINVPFLRHAIAAPAVMPIAGGRTLANRRDREPARFSPGNHGKNDLAATTLRRGGGPTGSAAAARGGGSARSAGWADGRTGGRAGRGAAPRGKPGARAEPGGGLSGHDSPGLPSPPRRSPAEPAP